MTDLRYPIGKVQFAPNASFQQRQEWIQQIEDAPALLRKAVAGLTAQQIDTPYREGGWTVRQVVHHVPDSHMNSYVRYRLALTEDEPTIRPYKEDLWAELEDARHAPLELSLALLDALHQRWVLLLKSIAPEDWGRAMVHPERGRVTLENNLAIYAWHGRHHVAHIASLRDRMCWV